MRILQLGILLAAAIVPAHAAAQPGDAKKLHWLRGFRLAIQRPDRPGDRSA